MDDVLHQIARCNDPKLLRSWIKNAQAQENEQVERAARLKLYEVLPSSEPGTVEFDVWKSIFALEDLETRRRGKTVRLQRTRTMIRDRGEHGTIERLLLKPTVSAGFQMLLDYGVSDLTFEAVALRHPDRFSDGVLARARQRLDFAGVAH